MTEDQGQADFTAEEVIMYCPAKDLQQVGSQEKMREKILTLSDEDQEGKVPINSMDVSKRFCYKMDDEELKKVLNDVIVEYIEKRMKELRGKLPIEQGEGLTYDRPIEDAEDFKAAIESLSKAEGKLMMKARDSEETKIKERLIDFLTELRALVNDLTSRPVSWVGNQAESSALTVFSEREPPEIFAPKAVLTKALAKKPSLDRMPFDADQNSIQLWSGRVPVDLLRIWINAIYEDPRTDLTVQEIQEKFRALNQTPPTMDIEVLSRSLSSVAKQASERFNRLLPEPVAAAPLKKSLSYRLYRDMVSSLYTTRPAEVVDDKDQVFYRRVDSDMDSLKLPRYSPSRVVVTTLTESNPNRQDRSPGSTDQQRPKGRALLRRVASPWKSRSRLRNEVDLSTRQAKLVSSGLWSFRTALVRRTDPQTNDHETTSRALSSIQSNVERVLHEVSFGVPPVASQDSERPRRRASDAGHLRHA